MLESLFGSKTIEKVLFYILINKTCYSSKLSLSFQESLSPFQKGLDRLEASGIIISFLEGKTRLYL